MKTKICTLPVLLVTGLVLLVLAGLRPAATTPIASLEYVETGLDGGRFQYDFTLYNLADAVLEPGFDIFDLFLSFPDEISLLTSTAPAAWSVISGIGFLDTFSLLPGPPPDGSDIAPGQSLGGFRLIFDGRATHLPFEVLFTNPLGFDPVLLDGVSAPAVAATPVPEPGSWLLVGTALGLGALARRRKLAP